MVIGIDMGASALKIAVIEGDEVLQTRYLPGRGHDVESVLKESGIDPEKADAVALTGLSAQKSGLDAGKLPLRIVPEPDAIGEGAVWLSGRDDVIAASIGTGTAFVHAKSGSFTHLCGTGVGGGTLRGLAEKLLGVSDMKKFDAMAAAGDYRHVDLLIGDFQDGYGILDPNMTASNLARTDAAASDEDWAAGITNLVLQVIGTMSLLARSTANASGVVVVGAVAGTEAAKRTFALFESAYGVPFATVPNSGCATAIGAARLCL